MAARHRGARRAARRCEPGAAWSVSGRTPDRPPRTGPGRPAASRTVRSWPLLVLAAPAAAEVWSGWVGIAQKTGFGLVSPLPGIWPSLHLDTAITLPVGVEAYAAYALRAWLASEHAVSARTRRFAKWSAICSFALGMAGQVAYHLLAEAGARTGAVGASPPSCPACRSWSWAWGPRWPTCCAPTPQRRTSRDGRSGGPADTRSPGWSAEDQPADQPDRHRDQDQSGSGPRRTRTSQSSPGPAGRDQGHGPAPVRLRGPAPPRSLRARQHRPVPPGASFPVPGTRGAFRHPWLPSS